MTHYTDKEKVFFVRHGIGSDSCYMTIYQKLEKFKTGGGAHRLVSKNLPVRETIEEAQNDLDAYAKKQKNWSFYNEDTRP